MKTPRYFCFCALMMLSSVPSYAGEGGYVGAAFTTVEYEEAGFDGVSPSAIQFVIGNQVSKNLAFEGRVGAGMSSDSITLLGTEVEVEVDSVLGAYLKGIAPLAERFAVYGVLGVTHGELTASVPSLGVSISDDDTDLSYGVGATVQFSDRAHGFAEWMSLLDGSNFEASGLSIGLAIQL